MASPIVASSTTAVLTPAESERVGRYLGSAFSPATRLAYASALSSFRASQLGLWTWCPCGQLGQ